MARGPRTLNGKILDIPTAASIYGGTESQWRARVDRKLVPFRRWGGRIIFLRTELDRFFEETLTGCRLDEVVQRDKARSRG